MIEIIEGQCKKKHYSMELSYIEADEDEVDMAQRLVKEKRLRGIIFLGGMFAHSEEKLKKLSVPFVFSTAGAIPENISKSLYSNIGVDDRRESRRMVDYLIGLGHRRIAIIVAEAEEGQSIGRLRLVCHVNQKMIPFSMESGYLAVKKLLAGGEEFTALYAVADTLAIGAERALYEAGLSVPDDVSVSGYDGIELANYIMPSLTTVRQPIEKMARETARLLFDIISGKRQHQHIVYEAELLERESAKAVDLRK